MVVSELRDAGNISRAAAQQYQSPNIHLSRCIELSERGRMYGAGLLGDMQKIIVKSQQFSGGLLTVSNLHDDDRAIILPALPKCEERLIWKCSLNSHHITASNGWPSQAKTDNGLKKIIKLLSFNSEFWHEFAHLENVMNLLSFYVVNFIKQSTVSTVSLSHPHND